MGLSALTIATEGTKGGMRLAGAVDEPKHRAVTLLSLKHSSAESAYPQNRREPSKGMSFKLAWTSPKSQWGGAKHGDVGPPRRQSCPDHTMW